MYIITQRQFDEDHNKMIDPLYVTIWVSIFIFEYVFVL